VNSIAFFPSDIQVLGDMNETTHSGVPCDVVHLQGEKGSCKTCFLQKLPASLLRHLRKDAECAKEAFQVCNGR